jgi:carbon-monoxide dehydrogenase medium subunit
MRDFNFHRPASVAEAVNLLRKHSGGKLLSGGQSLLPVLKLDMADPSDLISLSGIAELRGIRIEGSTLIIGAGMRHAEVAKSPEVNRTIPGLARLADHIGDAQVRNRGTLGGSLAHADPAADYPAAVVALDATVQTDRRSIAADDFFTGLFETALQPDEVITAVRFPIPARCAYAKFASHASKYALVGVLVAQGAGGVRVAVTGAGPYVFRVAALEKALSQSFGVSAIEALGASLGVRADDLNNTAEASGAYRAHLIGVLAKRAVAACL